MLWFFAANKVVYKVATITKTSTVIAHLIIFTLPHEVGSIFAASAQQMSDTIYVFVTFFPRNLPFRRYTVNVLRQMSTTVKPPAT